MFWSAISHNNVIWLHWGLVWLGKEGEQQECLHASLWEIDQETRNAVVSDGGVGSKNARRVWLEDGLVARTQEIGDLWWNWVRCACDLPKAVEIVQGSGTWKTWTGIWRLKGERKERGKTGTRNLTGNIGKPEGARIRLLSEWVLLRNRLGQWTALEGSWNLCSEFCQIFRRAY